MYVRPDSHRRRPVVPENYGGIAFSNEKEDSTFVPPPTDFAAPDDECDSEEKIIEQKKPIRFPVKPSFLNIDGEDLLLIGLIFLLAQSDMADDIIPLLIILLLC